MSVSTARLLSIALLALAACASRPSPTGVAVDPQVDEPSGLVASATHPGVYWTHGDSGNGNWLFAIDAEGKLLARYRVAATENVDWEDITRDDAGNLWLGDIGNNDGQRRDLAVLRLVEPDPSVGPEGVGEVRVAVAVAERGRRSKMENSPMQSPGPRAATVASSPSDEEMEIRTAPETMT